MRRTHIARWRAKSGKNHIAIIFSKLHINDRTQAVLYAIRQGLVKVE